MIISENVRVEDVAVQLDIFLEELNLNPVFFNPYFDFLKSSMWDKNTYSLHRANFFYRTELTVKAIAHVCSRAAMQEDQATLLLFSYILNEECGNGNSRNCHAVLMEEAHNLYGDSEFNLEPLLIKNAKNHPFIISETNEYRDKLLALINQSYPCMLGVVMALELHADQMLRVCRQAFQMNLKHLESKEYLNKVEIYFNCHIAGGVEERHAQDAKQCVLNNCFDLEDFDEIKRGAQETLKAQLTMWNGLYKKAIQLS